MALQMCTPSLLGLSLQVLGSFLWIAMQVICCCLSRIDSQEVLCAKTQPGIRANATRSKGLSNFTMLLSDVELSELCKNLIYQALIMAQL